MTVEAKSVCKDRSKWKEVISAYSNGKRTYVYMYTVKIFVFNLNRNRNFKVFLL
jgi:hypothetical protein